MTAEQIEYPAPPWVELYAPALTPEEVRVLTAVNSAADPRESWRNALMAHRVYVIEQMRKRLAAEALLSPGVIRSTLDTVWQLAFPLLHRATGPMVAEAYIQAFKAAGAGDIPIKMVYALAEEHVRRTGEYFHGTSSDALIQGFNTYVNRQVPAKAAMARVLDAYGLTPRQMSGLTSAKRFEGRVESSTPLALKSKIKSYIGKSISDRLGIFTRQESHNLNEQAQQIAWMWMVDHGKLPRTAEKMWLTAKDERVCAICGPLHRTKIPLGDRFILEDGQKLYVPGAHTNCRCKVRLQIDVTEIGKADRFDPREHPRGSRGRFVETPDRIDDPELERMVAEAKQLQEDRQKEAIQQIEQTPEAPPVAPLVSRQIKPLQSKRVKPLRTAAPLRSRSAQPLRSKQTTQAQPTPALQAKTKTPIALSLVMSNPAALRSKISQELKALSLSSPPRLPARPLGETPPGIPFRPTVKFHDRSGKARTVYMVGQYPVAVSPLNERVILTHEDELKFYDQADRDGTLAKEINEAYKRNLESKTREILEAASDNGHGSVYSIDQDGKAKGHMDVDYPSSDPALNRYHVRLSETDIKILLDAYVHRGSQGMADQRISYEWLDEDDEPVDFPDRHGGSTSELGVYVAEMIMDPGFRDPSDDDFEVVVVKLDEGYEDTTESTGGNDGELVFTTEGNYQIIGERKGSSAAQNALFPIRVLDVYPELPGDDYDLPHDRQGDWHP